MEESTVVQPCVMPSCDQISFAECNCCQRLMCKYHLTEHYNSLHGTLKPFVDEINALDLSLKVFDVHQATAEAKEKLEQWRVQGHEKIEQLYERKSRELDGFLSQQVERQTQSVQEFRTRLTEITNEETSPDAHSMESLSATLEELNNRMNRMKQTYIQIRIQPLAIKDDLFHITETIRKTVDLTQLSTPWKILEQTAKGNAVAISNEKHLLLHQPPYLCLVDQEINLIRQVALPFERIVDGCWSSTLSRFIVVNEDEIFFIHEDITHLQRVSRQQTSPFLSCTCSDQSLFLTLDEKKPSVIVYRLAPKIEFDQEWQYPLAPGQQGRIDCIVYNKDTLAMLVRHSANKTVQLELRFAATFDCVWTVPLDITWMKNIPFRCSLLSYDEWLIADYQHENLTHVTKSGQIKKVVKCNLAPYHTHLFKENILIILTKHSKCFHKLV